MDVTEFLERSTYWTSTRVGPVRPAQLSDPTPCTDWDVGALLNHIVGGALLYEAIARDAFDEWLREPRRDLSGRDPTDAYDSARTKLLAAFSAPGLAERTLRSHQGERPATELCGLIAADQLIHGWDLAVATGQDGTMPADLVNEARTLYAGVEIHRGIAFGDIASVPPDAVSQDELLAYCGRPPRWARP